MASVARSSDHHSGILHRQPNLPLRENLHCSWGENFQGQGWLGALVLSLALNQWQFFSRHLLFWDMEKRWEEKPRANKLQTYFNFFFFFNEMGDSLTFLLPRYKMNLSGDAASCWLSFWSFMYKLMEVKDFSSSTLIFGLTSTADWPPNIIETWTCIADILSETHCCCLRTLLKVNVQEHLASRLPYYWNGIGT